MTAGTALNLHELTAHACEDEARELVASTWTRANESALALEGVMQFFGLYFEGQHTHVHQAAAAARNSNSRIGATGLCGFRTARSDLESTDLMPAVVESAARKGMQSASGRR